MYFAELEAEVVNAKAALGLAKTTLNTWKPTRHEYQDEIDELIDELYPSVLGFAASQVLKKMDADKYADVAERVFQYHFDELTERKMLELAADVAECAYRLDQAETELCVAIDEQTEAVD